LRDSKLTIPRAITALGNCFRYESTNLTGLERLWDFAMREIVFVGLASCVLENRDKRVQVSAAFFERSGHRLRDFHSFRHPSSTGGKVDRAPGIATVKLGQQTRVPVLVFRIRLHRLHLVHCSRSVRLARIGIA